MIYNSTRKKYDLIKINEFDYVSCSNITDRKILDVGDLTHSNKDIQNMSICPDFQGHENEFRVADDLETNIYRRAELAFYPCSLEDQIQCASPQEFLHFTTYFGKMNKLVTPSNFEKPMTYSPTIIDIILNPYFSKFMKLAVHSNKIIDSKYELVAPQIKAEYANYEVIERDFNPRNKSQLRCSKQQIGLWKWGGCSEYLSIVFEVKREVFVMRRTYKRITDVFAKFGGIMKLLTEVVFFLYSWYNRSKIRSSIAAATFGFADDNIDNEKSVQKFIEFLNHNKGPETHLLQAQDQGLAQKEEEEGEKMAHLEKWQKKELTQKTSKLSTFNRNNNKKITTTNRNSLLSKFGILRKKKRVAKPKKDTQESSPKVELEQLLTEFGQQRSNASDLIEKINFLEFLQLILLDENIKKLLPLILLKARHQKQNAKKITKRTKNKFKTIRNRQAPNPLNPPQKRSKHLNNTNSKKKLQKYAF